MWLVKMTQSCRMVCFEAMSMKLTQAFKVASGHLLADSLSHSYLNYVVSSLWFSNLQNFLPIPIFSHDLGSCFTEEEVNQKHTS